MHSAKWLTRVTKLSDNGSDVQYLYFQDAAEWKNEEILK